MYSPMIFFFLKIKYAWVDDLANFAGWDVSVSITHSVDWSSHCKKKISSGLWDHNSQLRRQNISPGNNTLVPARWSPDLGINSLSGIPECIVNKEKLYILILTNHIEKKKSVKITTEKSQKWCIPSKLILLNLKFTIR